MKIRSVLSAAVLAVATTFASTQALAQDTITLRLAETWGPNFPIFGDATKRMAKLAEEMSGGRLRIRIDSANKHKAPFGVFDMVKAGQYDLGHSASYYWKGKVPETLFFTSMPFGMTAIEQYAWFYHGDGMELMQEVYAPHNMLSFPGGNTGVQMGGWFRKEIKSLDDLQGLKMRIPGFAGEVFAEVGVSPTNIPPGELYTALERNTIDAVEWVGPALDLRLGFEQIADYYYTGWHEPATELQFLVNKKEEHPNIQIKQFPADVFEAMYEANNKLLKEAAEGNEQAARIIESQEEYLTKTRAYTDISTRAYLNTMAEVE